jgi:lambda family phage tail tape measure protein
MDQLNIGVTTDAAKAADDLTKVSTSIDKVQTATEKMNAVNVNATRLINQNEAESRKFIAALQEEVNTYGKGREAVLQYRASQLGIANEAKTLIDQLTKMKAGSDAVQGAAHEMEQFGFQTAGAKRELLVLAHEASQGNWTRLGGSLMVLGERTNAMGLIFNSTGLAIGVAAAAVAALGYEVIKGAEEWKNLNDAIARTGNSIGLTAHDISDMSNYVAQSTGHTAKAHEALDLLVASGRVGKDVLRDFGRAVLEASNDTGQDVQTITAEFLKMQDGALKFAQEYQKTHHLLNAAQAETIIKLDEEGKQAEIVKVILSAMHDEHVRLMETQKQENGLITQYFQDWARGYDKIKASLMSLGAPESNFEKIGDKLKIVEAIKSNIANAEALGDEKAEARFKRELARTYAEIDSLTALENAKKKTAEATATEKKGGDAAFGLSSYLNSGYQTDAQRRADLVKEENKTFNEVIAAYQVGSAEYEKAVIHHKQNLADIDKQFRTEGKLSPYDQQKRSFGEDKARLDDQIKQYQEFGKAVDKSKLAILDLLIADGKFKGTSKAGIDDLRARAAALDTEERQLSAIKDKITAQKELDDENERARLAMEKSDRASADEIARLKEQTDAIGKTALQIREMTEARKIDAQTAELVAKFPRQEGEIRASAEKHKADYNTKAESADAQLKSWNTGMQNSMADFMDTASNDAANAKKLFTDAFQGAENAFVKFVETGKLSFKGLADSIISDLIRIETQKAEAAFLKMISSDTSTSPYSSAEEISMLGGAFADGGDPPVGVPSLVGEQGPEIFVPKTAGTIVPNNKIGGGPSVNYSPQIHIDSRTDQAQVHALVTAAVQRGNAQLVEHLQRANKLR